MKKMIILPYIIVIYMTLGVGISGYILFPTPVDTRSPTYRGKVGDKSIEFRGELSGREPIRGKIDGKEFEVWRVRNWWED